MAGSLPPGVEPPVVAWTASPESPIAVRRMLGETFARYGADPWRIIGLAVGPALVTTAFATATPIALLGTLLSLIAWSVMLVLADAGPHRLGLLPAIRRGLRRSGWLLLAMLGIFLIVMAVALVPALITSAALQSSIGLFFASLLGGLVASLLAFGRLGLALPATVVDGLSAGAALGRSRALTRSRAVFVRVAGAYVVVALSSSVVNAAIGFVRGLDVGPPAVVVIVGTLAVAIVSPLAPLLLLVLYRRVAQVVDPLDERASLKLPPLIRATETAARTAVATGGALTPAPLTAAPDLDSAPAEAAVGLRPEDVSVAAAQPATSVEPETAATTWTSRPPALGKAGRALAVVVGAAFVAGLGAFAWSGSQVRGFAPDTAVPPGEVQFGSEVSLATCTIPHPATVFGRGAPVAWIARYSRPTTTFDVVRLRVTRDGVVIVDEQERPQAAACLGTSRAETGVIAGTYEFVVTVNDEIRAKGQFTALR